MLAASLLMIHPTRAALPGTKPDKPLLLARFGNVGMVNASRASALQIPDTLRTMLSDGNVAILLAGIGVDKCLINMSL